mmetsp:Transcript_5352/g.10680  ORF Transcript_5352/g.10680 Transcript_5352/m.10680 type:complete len:507 (-) Transcript_5352:56-1576(-)
MASGQLNSLTSPLQSDLQCEWHSSDCVTSIDPHLGGVGDVGIPGVHGQQNLGVAPGKILGAHLCSSVAVDLLVKVAAVLSDVLLEPKHDTVTSSSKGLRDSSNIRRELNVEALGKLSKGVGLRGPVLEGVGSSTVKELSQSSGRKNPRVSVGVGVSGVTANEYTGDGRSSIGSIDRIFGAEGSVENIDGGGNFNRCGGVLGIRRVKSIVESDKYSAVLLAVGLLRNERAGPVRIKLGVNGGSGCGVGSGGLIVAHGSGKLSTHDHSLLHSNAVPEEIGGLDLLPEIARVAVPSTDDPVEVSLNGLPEARGDIILGWNARVGVRDQRNSTKTRAIVLRAAPSSIKNSSIRDLELGLDADVNSIMDGSLSLPSEDPSGIGLHGSLVGGVRGRSNNLKSTHGKSSIPHPVVVVVSSRSVVIRGSNDSANLLYIDVVHEVSLHSVNLIGGEGGGISGVLENEARPRLVAFGIEAPGTILILEGRPAAASSFTSVLGRSKLSAVGTVRRGN